MFAAIFTRASRIDPREIASGETLLAALFPYTQPDVSGVWSSETALIAQGVMHNTPESAHERAPEVCADTGRVIASWVRLDNREELCTQLKLEHRSDLTDPQIILAAHRTWGRDCAKRLEGDFSFVIYDPARHEVFCARDAIGARPMFYMLSDEMFVVATSVAAMQTLRGISLTPDLRWTAMFLIMLNFLHTQAAYENVRKLAPGHDLTVAREEVEGPREFFTFDLTSPRATQRDPKWVEAYREAFDQAVRVRARSGHLVAAESSGGLDSSSIVSTLVEYLPHSADDFHCFGLLSFEKEADLLLATAAMRDIRNTHILAKPPLLRIDHVFDRALKALGHPPEHWQMISHPSFFELGQMLGIRTLMSGYGGDEVLTSFATNMVWELREQGSYAAVLDEMTGALPLRIARFAKFMAKGKADPFPMAKEVLAANFHWACVNREFYEDSGIAREVEAWLSPESELTLNAITMNRPGFKVARTARLESASIFAATYGMEYRWPLYDRQLLQQYFATPAIEKRRRNLGRYLHRRAMQGRIPEQILWQIGKDLGNHTGERLNVEVAEPCDFDALPAILRSMIDRHAYEKRTKFLQTAGLVADEDTINAHVFLWQLRQLAEWLA